MLRFDCATDYDSEENISYGYMESSKDGSYVQYAEVVELLALSAINIANGLDTGGFLAPGKEAVDVFPLVLGILTEVFNTT
jgi:hypothetical protein